MFTNLLLASALLFAAPAGNKQVSEVDSKAAKCAALVKMCTDCQTSCDTCFQYCSTQVTAGQKGHAAAMECCLGCADACRLASTLAARHSPMAMHAGDCCMKCCADCATACEKMPDDKIMAECAKMCRACEKHCLTMMKDASSK